MIPALGVGFPYVAELPAALYQSGLMDFVEVTPETICRQRAAGSAIVIDIVPDQLDRARATCAGLPIVVHGVELSIGSAHGWNAAYLDMLDSFEAACPFVWHSEHLGFQTIPGLSRRYVTDFGPCPIPTMAATTMQSVAAKPSSCEFSQVRGQNIMSRVTTRGDS